MEKEREEEGWGGEEDEIKQEKRQTKCFVHSASVSSSVGGDGLVDPAPEFGHAGVHTRVVHFAVWASPRSDPHQGPHPTSLKHQRTTGVTLEKRHSDISGPKAQFR